MEKEINNNAVSELDEASLEQVTGGTAKHVGVPVVAIGGGDVAEPEKVCFTDYPNEMNKVRDKASPFGK